MTLVVQARGKTVKVGFTRPAYEEATQKLVDECKAFLIAVRDKAGVASWQDVDAVILTGGGTRIPSIKRMVLQETGREPVKGINPDEGVAIGALYWGLFARSNREKDAKKPGKK